MEYGYFPMLCPAQENFIYCQPSVFCLFQIFGNIKAYRIFAI
jgi:hypothetical protein